MGSSGKHIHVFMVSFPGQGHVNPLLRLGRRLANFGLLVTFCAPEAAGASIRKANTITGDEPIPCGRGSIRFEFFDDGWDFNNPNRDDLSAYLVQLELTGRQKLPEMIRKQDEAGRPVSCVINNPFIPWVIDVAEILGIPSAMLWIQSCACFSSYYHYYNNLAPSPTIEEPEMEVKLPNLPLLKHDEFPSYLHPTTPYGFLRDAVLGQFRNLSKPFCILMDTFQELEKQVIDHMMSEIGLPIKTIGPVFKPSQQLDKSNAIRADFYEADDDCINWLDSKPPRSVVYMSFGSIVNLLQEQVDEIAGGLAESGVEFLWVLRPPPKEKKWKPHVLPEGFVERVGKRGKIVKWSPQDEVLAHPSTACFVTHCGWNSTMEALTSGVPVVAFPQWGDQVTNAKFLVDVWKVGIRMCRGEAEGRVVPKHEVARILTAAISANHLRENALEWKKAAAAAVADGGSSYNNMQEFVDQVARIARKC